MPTTELIIDNIWPRIKKETRKARRPVYAAIAYFGQGASKILPLPKGSKLVVDASEASVKAGRTCPAELKKYKGNVTVYSIGNLHAKVIVVGSRAFIGSMNVSKHSSDLVEAVVSTTDAKVVRAARQFVRKLCLNELGPEELARLQKLYHPPKFTSKRKIIPGLKKHAFRLDVPRVLLAHLEYISPPEGSEAAQEKGSIIAKKRMEKPRSHELDEMWRMGKCPFREGEKVIQILKEADGRQMVSPPGTIVHIQRWEKVDLKYSFMYLELPKHKRIEINRLAHIIGRGARKRLLRSGPLNALFAEKLLEAWNN